MYSFIVQFRLGRCLWNDCCYPTIPKKLMLTQGHKTQNDLVCFTVVTCPLLPIEILSHFKNILYLSYYVKSITFHLKYKVLMKVLSLFNIFLNIQINYKNSSIVYLVLSCLIICSISHFLKIYEI